jgi:hypothetical protein
LKLSSEFRLVAASCRWPPSPARTAAIEAAAASVSDWDLVRRIAGRHRVEGLTWQALRESKVAVPEEASTPLRAAAERIGRQNLSLAAESLRLRRALEGAGVAPLFVKGVTLGALAYGSIGPKMGWDIDLLVLPAQVEAAAAALEAAGYSLTLPSGPGARRRLGFWHVHAKESVWVSAARGAHVELHTALTDNPRLLGGVGPFSPAREVEVAKGMSLPTLGTDELFAYLCVHGASSAWFRLKWIADVAALIGAAGEAEVERLYRRSQALGAGRASAQALLLARTLFETPLSPALQAELRSDRVNRWLLTVALRKLAGRAGVREVDSTPLGTATIHLMQLGLLPGLRFKLSEAARQLASPADRMAVNLPRPLAFLYPFVFAARRLAGRAP